MMTPAQTIAAAEGITLTAAGKWTRNNKGEEYCTVSHGLHAGTPDCETDNVDDLLAIG